jgi:hypothetical protein
MSLDDRSLAVRVIIFVFLEIYEMFETLVPDARDD